MSPNEKLCSETTVYINEVIEDNLQESCVSINKDRNLSEFDTVYR